MRSFCYFCVHFYCHISQFWELWSISLTYTIDIQAKRKSDVLDIRWLAAFRTKVNARLNNKTLTVCSDEGPPVFPKTTTKSVPSESVDRHKSVHSVSTAKLSDSKYFDVICNHFGIWALTVFANRQQRKFL